MVLLKDIASACGVSIAAVSQILNNRECNFCSEETKQKVRDTAKKLGYRANFGYRLMRGQKTKTIAIIAAGHFRPQEEHVKKLILSLMLKYETLGFSTYFATTGMDDTENISKINELLNRGAEYFVFLYEPHSQGMLTSIIDSAGKKWISIDSSMRRYVAMDIQTALRQLITTLFQLSGGAFHYLLPMRTDRTRYPAIKSLFPNLSDREIQERYIWLAEPDMSNDDNFQRVFNAGYAGCDSLLKAFPETRAIQCGNDNYLLGAVQAALKHNRIPGKDIFLGGFNGDYAVLYHTYPLATAYFETSELVDLLIQHLDAEECRIMLPPKVVIPKQYQHKGEI